MPRSRSSDAILPARSVSSTLIRPSVPAQTTWTGRPSSESSRTVARRLANAPTITRSASRQARIARVPLVVVMTRVLPRQTSGVKSEGEFPRSNPGMGTPCRSPASSAEPAGRAEATRRASSISPQGMIADAPRRQGVDHRRRGPEHVQTTATPPCNAPGGIRAGKQVDEDGRPRRTRASAIYPGGAVPVRLGHCRDYGMPAHPWGDRIPSEAARRRSMPDRPMSRPRPCPPTFGFASRSGDFR